VSNDVHVSVCRSCGRAVFPHRALCPACGGASWARERAGPGVVEEVTTVRHAVGAEGPREVSLASVRLEAGPVVVAGVEGRAAPGDRVELVAVGGALVGRAREERVGERADGTSMN
jgi:uncharacterized OB-fold protein